MEFYENLWILRYAQYDNVKSLWILRQRLSMTKFRVLLEF